MDLKVILKKMENDISGYYSYIDKTIYIDRDVPERKHPLIFLHELAHKILDDEDAKLSVRVNLFDFMKINQANSLEDILETIRRFYDDPISTSILVRPSFWEEVIAEYLSWRTLREEGFSDEYKILRPMSKNKDFLVVKDIPNPLIIDYINKINEVALSIIGRLPYLFGIYLAENYSFSDIFGGEIRSYSDALVHLVNIRKNRGREYLLEYIENKLMPYFEEFLESKYYNMIKVLLDDVKVYINGVLKLMKSCELKAGLLLDEILERKKFDSGWEKHFKKVLSYALFFIEYSKNMGYNLKDVLKLPSERSASLMGGYVLDAIDLAKEIGNKDPVDCIDNIVGFFEYITRRLDDFEKEFEKVHRKRNYFISS